MADTPPSTIDKRREQMFPRLDEDEIARMAPFGEQQRYGAGDRLFEAGTTGPGMFVVLSGSVRIVQRDGMGHESVIVEQGPGQFLAEVGQLSGAVAFVDGKAVGDVDVLLIAPDRLRALLVAEAELGERIMRALILRRVSLIETGAGGPVLIGGAQAAGAQLSSFLTRNGFPHQVLDVDSDAGAQEVLQRLAPRPEELPLVVLTDGTILRHPSEAELAAKIGMVGQADPDKRYDVAIVGAGPAGLAAAVYASSEGLEVLAVDLRAFGGQAGASMRIENLLGFPTGISGQALAGRAFVQAQKFGTDFAIPAEVKRLACDAAKGHAIEFADGSRIHADAIVIASGASYRRPDIEHLAQFEGNGVWYWASPVEAKLCQGLDIALVGGGNSAGQAAVYLSTKVKTLTLLVRGKRLEDGMSQYLVERIAAAPNITVSTRSEVTGLEGSAERGLERVRWRSHGEAEQARPIRHLFLFIGADPATGWLGGCGIALDDKGFVRTGSDAGPADAEQPRAELETSVPGVFAIGDVRSGSVKRVGGAIGEGAAVVAALHRYLEDVAR